VHESWIERPLTRLAEALALESADRARLSLAARAELVPQKHGDLARWHALLRELPTLAPTRLELNQPCVKFDGDGARGSDVEPMLRQLCPWRKGPFRFFGVEIDAEWRSDRKWARLEGDVAFQGARVLDVGSGNGYSSLRALGAGARGVLAIDPGLLAIAQFLALTQHTELPAALLPLRLEQLPSLSARFDVVLSMGVLSHRRDPGRHLEFLVQRLARGAQLVLETLVLDVDTEQLLVPGDRYAAMRNVWMLPSVPLLCEWLRRAGLGDVRLIDCTKTTPDEQRTTSWMSGPSLADFLSPSDPSRTIEGHPAPMRALLLARAPG
jgi:tRNA (mo5U34)-methyltransferase